MLPFLPLAIGRSVQSARTGSIGQSRASPQRFHSHHGYQCPSHAIASATGYERDWARTFDGLQTCRCALFPGARPHHRKVRGMACYGSSSLDRRTFEGEIARLDDSNRPRCGHTSATPSQRRMSAHWLPAGLGGMFGTLMVTAREGGSTANGFTKRMAVDSAGPALQRLRTVAANRPTHEANDSWPLGQALCAFLQHDGMTVNQCCSCMGSRLLWRASCTSSGHLVVRPKGDF